MLRILASHNTRLIGYSRAKPLPPWICNELSAAVQAILVDLEISDGRISRRAFDKILHVLQLKYFMPEEVSLGLRSSSPGSWRGGKGRRNGQ